jgi:SAM-dependent methyltransferase
LPPPSRLTKPDLGGGISHPARFSDKVLALVEEGLRPSDTLVLDPFGGTGRAAALSHADRKVFCVELEEEWARLTPKDHQYDLDAPDCGCVLKCHETGRPDLCSACMCGIISFSRAIQGDALNLPFPDDTFDGIVTSPCFGNRLADSHNAQDGSLRRSYTHDLGRKLREGNAGVMQWGPEYRVFHRAAWTEVRRVLKPGGRFVLDIKDHQRAGTRQRVVAWHVRTIKALGFTEVHRVEASVQHLRQGENRVRYPEYVITFGL